MKAKLTSTQYGIYLESIANPQRTTYNIPLLLKIPAEFAIKDIEAAANKLIGLHPALDSKIVFDPSGDVYMESGAGNKALIIEMSDQEFTAYREKLVRVFDFSKDLPARIEIYKTPAGNYFFIDINHIIFDGVSCTIFARDMLRLLKNEEVEAENYTLFDIAEEEEKARKSEIFEEEKSFYEKLLEGYDPDCLPVPNAEYSEIEQGWYSKEFEVDEQLLKELKNNKGISKGVFFTTVMGYLLAKYNFTDSSVISTVYSDRNEKTKNTIDMLVKTMPFVTDLTKTDSIEELLSICSENLRESRKRTVYSYVDMASDLGLKNDINFAFQGHFADAEIIEGYETERIYDSAHIEETKILCEVYEVAEGRYRFHIGYRKDYFTESFAKGLVRAYINAAEGFLNKKTLSEISLLDEEETKLLDSFNDTDCDFNTDNTIVDLFRKNVKEIPDSLAVVHENTKISYKELDERTDRLAYYLKNKGLGAEGVVAVLIPRCEHMAICSLGVLKAGAAYMPLDPSYPPERLNLMVQDSNAKILITTDELSQIINDEFKGQRMTINEVDKLDTLEKQYKEVYKAADTMPDEEARKKALEELLEAAPKPENLFIMLYTSGSTGTPKGVMLEHFNLMTFTAWCRKSYKLGTESRNAAYASYGFDACMLDLYPTLTAGGCVYIISEDIRLDLKAVHKYFAENKITHAFMTTQIARQFATMGNPGSLISLSTGGEKLVSMDPPDYIFRNAYGPTETTVFATIFDIDKKYKDIPIGKALENVKLYVVDAKGKRLPVGAAGELWIAGPQVSRGYLNRPEKTAEVYLNNPFDKEEKYRRTYKTGDIVRFLEDGNIQFVGRRDAQVKVRGFRIELTEVEEIIRRAPGIKDVTVQAYDDAAGGKYLCAYVVSKNAGEEVDIQAVNEFIMEEKPPYMVPAVTMQIDEIPYNQNQKVNKRALPAPERKAEDMTAPENENQQKIFDIIAEIIGHTEFGINTDIYEAGLSSIGAVQLNIRLSEAFETDIKTRDLKENSCVKKLEKLLINSSAEDEVMDETLSEADKAAKKGIFSITKTQQGIFAECMAHPDSTIYNIPLMYELNEAIEPDRLKEAVCKAVNNHPYILSRLYMAEDGKVKCDKNQAFSFENKDIEEHELKGAGFEAVMEYAQKLVKPYVLVASAGKEAERLFRVHLIKADRNYILIDMHHIISDGSSLNILFNDISSAYQGKEISPESKDGFLVALAEENALESKKFDKAKSFYKELLEGADTDSAPAKDVHGKEESSDLFVFESDLKPDELKEFCQKNSISMVTLFNAAFGYALSKYTYKDDVVYTTVYNGRNDINTLNTMSMLVKTLPVRAKYTKEQTVKAYLEDIEYQMADSMSNDIYSFAEISRAFDVNADIMFTYQGDLFNFDHFCGFECKSVEMELDSAKADMDIDVNINANRLELVFSYRSDKYSEEFIKGFSEIICLAAKQLTIKSMMAEIDILAPDMLEKLEGFNDTGFQVADECANRMFERHAKATSDKKAFIAAGEELTYGQLNALANKLANELIRKGVKQDEIIGLISERRKEAIIGEMGIMKAGAAFLPMVPEYPDDRIDYCLTDADSRFVITSEAIASEKSELFVNKAYTVITFEEILGDMGKVCEANAEELEQLAKENPDYSNPDIEIPTSSLCYCIYTSGSTGTPKGVMIEHRNLRNFLDPNNKNPETANYPEYGHVVLSVISISFDFSLMELQLPLANGLTVCMASEDDIHDPVALAKLMKDNSVDVMSGTPSFIGNLIDVPQIKEALANMKLYDFGAEAFPTGLFDKLKMASPEAIICNGYGPTEATISCISKSIDSGDGITIGWPAANVYTYVCDKDMNLLPIGATGELVIGGLGVGRGYVKLPEKTAAVFVDLRKDGRGIYTAEEIASLGEDYDKYAIRAYRTGDRVRILSNGEIEFFGRLDNQVKLRGFRVELDEIENNINTFPGVQVSKVIVRNNGSEDYLAGFFTADTKIDLAELTAHLKEKLTYYMVPSVLMQLDEMPLTVNGKIDKKRLPEVEFSATREYVEPETELERSICDMFGQVLHQEKIGVTDDFFEIGGTSLTATSIVLKLADLGYDIVYKDVFEYTTPREMAEFISGVKVVSKYFSDDYNYAEINKIIAKNSMDNIESIEKKELGNIIITGASGFLGIHVLYEFLTKYEGKAYCLVRKGKYDSPGKRLKNMLMYYFGDAGLIKYNNRVECIDGDITDLDSVALLKEVDADTLINCAALVKHFVQDDSLDRINVGGVKNLIELCLESGKELVQISTVSVGGSVTAANMDKKIHENELYFKQIIDNDYIRTKFLAERELLEAVAKRGLKGKIVRVGNLMSRNSDGEFQINFITNGFMRSLKAFKQLGAFPMTSMYSPAEFSPIDSTAGAILALAAQESEFTIFHAYNSHIIYMSDVIYAMKHYGFNINIVDDEEFGRIMQEASKNEKFSDALLGLIAYNSNSEDVQYIVDSDNRFTTEVLYRLDYLWPITDNEYLFNAIRVLDEFEFFDLED